MYARPLTSRKQYLLACLVGVGAGLLAVAFRYLLDLAAQKRLTLPPGALVAVAVLGAVASLAVTRRVPEISGSGIPYLKVVIRNLRALIWQRVLPAKFLGGLFGLGAGMALGREGPTVQMGASVGELLAERTGLSDHERRELVAAGSGAGLAAAFNAPLSGMVFVLEELHANFTSGTFLCTLVAAASADMVTRLFLGQQPAFHLPSVATPPLSWGPAFVLLGLTAGLAGTLFNRTLLASLSLFPKLFGRLSLVGGAVAGLLVGLAGCWMPAVTGDGERLLELLPDQSLALDTLLAMLAVRLLLTLACYGCGAPGGIFAPLLVLGALHGLVFARLTGLEPLACMVVSMAAYFTAIVRAPLTGMVLILEMTLSYNLMLPLLLACGAASVVCELTGNPPIYDAMMERDTTVVAFRVRPGAPFEGRSLAELDLPEGCQAVGLGPEDVLRAGDELTASIDSEADETLEKLRLGTGCSAGNG